MDEYDHQLRTGDIQYRLIKDRRYNSLVCAPKAIRKEVLYRHGYNFDYDINSAVVSLMYQEINRINKTKPIDQQFDLTILGSLIRLKTEIREYLASEFNITLKSAKAIINAIVFGAPISASKQASAIANIVGIDNIPHLKSILGNVVTDTHHAWKFINSNSTNPISGRLGGKQYSTIYSGLELKVQQSIQQFLDSNNHKALFIHDGFVTDKMIDIDAFNQYMEQTLGFDSMFSMSFDSLIDIDNRTKKLDYIFSFSFSHSNSNISTNNAQSIRVPAEASACAIINIIQATASVTTSSNAPSIVVYTSSKNKEHSTKSRVVKSTSNIIQYPLVLLVNTFFGYGRTQETPDRILNRIFIWLMQIKEKNLVKHLRCWHRLI